MTFGELVDFMAKICYTTSDKSAYAIHEIYKDRPSMHEAAMRQYIYAKISICCFLSLQASNSSNVDQAINVVQALLDKMCGIFKSMPSSMNYGCNESEMRYMVGEYQVGDQFDFEHMALMFVGAIGDSNVFNLSKMVQIFECCEKDLRNQLLGFYQKKSGAAGASSGCGCTVATLGLLVISVLVCVLL